MDRPLFPTLIRSLADLLPIIERLPGPVLALWDVDDTLLASQPPNNIRERFLENSSIVEEVFRAVVSRGAHSRNVLLSAGSIDDLFLTREELGFLDDGVQPLLRPLTGSFVSANPPNGVQRVWVHKLRQYFCLDAAFRGFSLNHNRGLFTPSRLSITVPPQSVTKLDIVFACCCSGIWQSVVFVDNQLGELGIADVYDPLASPSMCSPQTSSQSPRTPSRSPTSRSPTSRSPTTRSPSRSLWPVCFTSMFSVLQEALRLLNVPPATIVHLRVSETHSILADNRGFTDTEYRCLVEHLYDSAAAYVRDVLPNVDERRVLKLFLGGPQGSPPVDAAEFFSAVLDMCLMIGAHVAVLIEQLRRDASPHDFRATATALANMVERLPVQASLLLPLRTALHWVGHPRSALDDPDVEASLQALPQWCDGHAMAAQLQELLLLNS